MDRIIVVTNYKNCPYFSGGYYDAEDDYRYREDICTHSESSARPSQDKYEGKVCKNCPLPVNNSKEK